MLVNTGRGALIDTLAVIDGLKTGQIGSLALDVYEEEAELFFEDRSAEIISDDVFARLLTFPNVLITAHQAFLTREALDAIAATTLANLDCLAAGEPCPNRLSIDTGRSGDGGLGLLGDAEKTQSARLVDRRAAVGCADLAEQPSDVRLHGLA